MSATLPFLFDPGHPAKGCSLPVLVWLVAPRINDLIPKRRKTFSVLGVYYPPKK